MGGPFGGHPVSEQPEMSGYGQTADRLKVKEQRSFMKTIVRKIRQDTEVFDAACLGAYINGLAGEKAAHKKGEYGILATDITENIPLVMEELKQKCNKNNLEI